MFYVRTPSVNVQQNKLIEIQDDFCFVKDHDRIL
jgi:hypothetical protein